MKRIFRAALCLMMMVGFATADTLKVDRMRSRIQVDGRATGHVFTGDLEDYAVKVSGDISKLEPTSFVLEWKFEDLKTGDEKRDKNMIKWLGGGAPSGLFTFIKTWERDGKKYAEGELTIHGVSKKVSCPYTVKKEGKWVTISGGASLDYKDFKLPLIRTLAVMTVDPKLLIRFHIVGEL